MKNKFVSIISIALSFLAVLSISCKKDKPLKPGDPTIFQNSPNNNQLLIITDVSLEDTLCQSVADTGIFVPIIYDDTIQFETPSINPNNPNEFIYYYKNYNTGAQQLIKYNVISGNKSIVLNNYSSKSAPNWGSNDKIGFCPNYDLKTINSDGSNLSLNLNDQANLYPCWSANGDYIYWHHSPVLGHPYFLMRKNLQTSLKDTIMYSSDSNFGYARFPDISSDNKMICETLIDNGKFIGYSNLNSFKMEGLVNLELNNMLSLADICWAPNGKDFYFSIENQEGAGLFKMNVDSPSQATRLVSHCGSKYYETISCSPDGNFLLGERVYKYVDSIDGKTYKRSEIYKIDLNTLEETKIDLE